MRTNRALAAFLAGLLACLVGGCATGPMALQGHPTVAVWDLENLTPDDSGHVDLGEPMAAKMIETLKQSQHMTIIERQRLVLALEELHLGTSAIVDENTRLQIGKMIGAQFMVFGAYQVIADTMRIDARLVEVETGKVKKAAKEVVSGTGMSVWLKAAGDVAKKLF